MRVAPATVEGVLARVPGAIEASLLHLALLLLSWGEQEITMRMAWEKLIVVGFVASIVGGCAIRTRVDASGGEGGSGGSGGASSSSGAGGHGGSASSSSGSGGMMGAGGGGTAGGSNVGGGGSTGSGGAGAACGGFSGATCPADQYCDFPDDTCGVSDGAGTCKPRPSACPDLYAPTCACDSKVYSNPCDAAAAGFDISNLGSCMAPSPSQFSCGHGFCDRKTQYCQRTLSDVFGMPDDFACMPLPAACGSMPSCACLANEPCAKACGTTIDNGLILNCPGG
jgi:hypothetical protein